MYMVESKGVAIICMFFALIFLGTWPAILTLLERRGRHPQHTYIDDSLASLLVAIIVALTFGQIGSSRPDIPDFITQLSQDNWPCVLFAVAGGLFQSFGNLSTQYAWAYIGLSVTEVITSSVAVIIGTTMNFFLDNQIDKAVMLFFGVGCFLIAVFLASALHSSNTDDNQAKLNSSPSSYDESTGYISISIPIFFYAYEKWTESISGLLNIKRLSSTNTKAIEIPGLENAFPTFIERTKDLEQVTIHVEKAKVGTADFLRELESKRAIKALGRSKTFGVGITFFSGICFSLYAPALNLATNDQWHLMKKGVAPLVVYTAFFYFSISYFIATVILNITFLYHPILNLPKSSLKAYLNDWNGRPWAILSGILCGFGNVLHFIGGQAAGYAAADSVQALPLVSTFWGIVLFGEYRRSSQKTYMLLASMLVMFVVATGSLMASAGHR